MPNASHESHGGACVLVVRGGLHGGRLRADEVRGGSCRVHEGGVALHLLEHLLVFLARLDRIELGEIEVALHSLTGMQAAACLYDAARDRILCVYAGGMEPDALAKDLRKLLPKYMLPNLYEKLEALPYNANGKIDRVALRERYLHAEG